MFDFRDINKLLRYKWSNFFINCEPKGNTIKMSVEEYKKIFSSIVCRVIGEIVKLIGTLLLISTILEIGGESIIIAGVSTKISLFTFFPLIFAISILSYIMINKDKEQKTYFYIALMAFIFIGSIGSLVSLFGFISSLFVNSLSGLLGICSIFLILMGNVGIFSGIIDYCERAKNEYDKMHTVTTMDSEIIMKPIDINDISDHTMMKCPNCGNDVNLTANFCKHCGNKL